MINKYQSILRMKNSILATLTAGIIFILLFTVSCNKKDISIINSSDNATKEMILSYLNEQKIVDLNASLFIDTLISKSDWSDLSESSISKDVKLIYVPLNYSRNRIGMMFLYNNNTQSIYYSLITETPLSISSVTTTKNLILNKPSDVILPIDQISPIDVIAGFYKYNMNGYTGSIKAFSLSNTFLWEYGYQNGNRKYERLITNSNIVFESNKNSPKQSYSVGSNLVKSSGCTMFYLVTYYDDGSIDINYLGERCDTDKSCQTTIGISEKSDIIKLNCGAPGGGREGGGGSGNNEIDKIINNITDPCLKELVSKLQNANKLTNSIGGILVNVFGKNEKIILNFSQDDDLKNSKGEDLYGESYVDNNGVYQTKLNARLLNNDFSEERQTLTIMHEVLHDYFNNKIQEELKTYIPNQHTFMLRYINQMATTLEDLYPQLRQNPNLALALVFDDLESSVFRGDSKLSIFEQSAEGKIPRQLYDDAVGLSVFKNVSTYQALAIQAKGAKSNLGTKPCTTSNVNNN